MVGLPVLALATRIGVISELADAALTLSLCFLVLPFLLARSQRSKLTWASATAMFSIALTILIGTILHSESIDSLLHAVPTVIPFALVGCMLLSPQQLWRVIRMSSLAGGATLAATLLALPLEHNLELHGGGPSADPTLHDYGRMTGPLSHPNAFGSFSALIGISALAMHRGWRRWVILALSIVCTLASGQRSAGIALFVGLLLYGATSTGRTLRGWYLRTLALITIPAALVWLVNDRLLTALIDERVDSVHSREFVWSWTFDNLSWLLPWGVGPDRFYDATQGIYLPIGFAHPHNTWLTYLVMGGVLCAAAGVYLTAAGMARSWSQRDVSTLCMAFTVAVLGISESPTFAGRNWLILPVALLSILVTASPWMEASQTRSTQTKARRAGPRVEHA